MFAFTHLRRRFEVRRDIAHFQLRAVVPDHPVRSLHYAMLRRLVQVGNAKAGLCDDAENGENYPQCESVHV